MNKIRVLLNAVLILVVVDNGLVQTEGNLYVAATLVLILVVVDNGLVLKLMSMVINEKFSVLILVVVDNGLVLVSP